MKNNLMQDMTVGKPMKLFLYFCIPVLLGNLFQQFYNMADSVIVGRFVSLEALAGVGSSGSIMFTTLGFSMGLSLGFSVIISQRFGAKDMPAVRSAIAMSIYLSLIISIIMSVGGLIFADDLLRLTNTPEEIFKYANDYLVFIFIGSGAMVFYNLFSSILRAVGDSKTPLYFLILASVLNVALDFVFVLIIPMGAAGVGLATTLAQGISALLCAVYVWKKQPELKLSREDFKIDKHMIAVLMRLGLPSAFQNSITGIGVVVVQYVVNGFGAVYVAAYITASKVHGLALQAFPSIGTFVATYVGQNLGANKPERIRKGVNQTLIASIIIGFGSTAFCYLFTPLIATLFVDPSETEVIKFAHDYLKVLSPFYFSLGVLFVYRSALNGLGNMIVPMITGFLELGCRIAASLTLPLVFGFIGLSFADFGAWFGANLLLVPAYYMQMRRTCPK